MRIRRSAAVACLLGLMAGTAFGGAAPRTHIRGTLKGFFLTPAGQLQVHALDVAGPPHAPSGEGLHPLWSSYYFRAVVDAPEPTSRVRVIASGDGTVLYDERFATPATALQLPTGEGQFIGAHVRHGLSFRFELTSAAGRVSSINATIAGARLLPVPELKIDWLDLIRISEVRRMLCEKGNEILPGFRADDVPFALKGDDDQLVLIDHPKPPKGFHRYTGPLPVAMKVEVGTCELQRSPAGEMIDVGGADTATFEYRPTWAALPDAGCGTQSNWDVSFHIGAIVHEACHVVWHRRLREAVSTPAEGMQVPPLEVRVNQFAELAALEQAVGSAGTARRSAILDYLALHERRAGLNAVEQTTVTAQDRVESDEGLACYAEWKAASVLESLAAANSALHVDPFFDGLYPADPLASYGSVIHDPRGPLAFSLYYRLSLFPTLGGFAQARLLANTDTKLLDDVWTHGTTCFATLAKAAGYAQLTADLKLALQREAWNRWHGQETLQTLNAQVQEQSHALEAALHATRAGKGIVLHAREALYGDPLHKVPFGARQWLANYTGCGVNVEQSCFVTGVYDHQRGVAEVETVLNPGDGLIWAHRAGDSLSLRTKEVTIDLPHAVVSERKDGLHISSVAANDPNQLQEGCGDQMKRTGLYILPLALLAASGPVLAQLPCQTLTFMVSGNFKNADNGQIVNTTLDLVAERAQPTGNWQMLTGETYTEALTYSDPQNSRIAQVTLSDLNGNVVDTQIADPPTTSLTAHGTVTPTATFAADDWTFHGDHAANCAWSGGAVWHPGTSAPPGSITVTVADGAAQKAFLNAGVSVWIDGQPGTTQTHQTDLQGKAQFTGLTSGNYMIGVTSPMCCHLQKGPYEIARGTTQTESFAIWHHAGIGGTVKFLHNGQVVPGNPAGVQIVLLQNGTKVGTGTVSTTQNADGTYNYTIGPPPAAGAYTVQATLNGQQQQQSPVTVPDDCTPAQPNLDGGGLQIIRPAAHTLVSGPTFTFTVGP